ncbi:hypothetical protein LEL_05864 [Akanthomyces lecanii RCEF 1005]|uniref:Uncharacterized protein n=1 Tax=Akanthomyces lecanii RCEF 1005 TaxID=1081108 RepID=A0A168G8T1_CORDF|nr:hypothetical protein LEL_05864 [Akanthomyces lecanii RCEF 1005]
MSRPGSQSNILGQLDSADLGRSGLSGPVLPDGTFRLHRRRLNRFSDEENQGIPLNVPLASSDANEAFASIPAEIISKATLVYVGFDLDTATLLWSKWTNREQDGGIYREGDPIGAHGEQMAFLDFMSGGIGERGDTWDTDNQKWIDCMNAYGMAREFQEAILDPQFNDIRHQQTCVSWIKETIQVRYDALHEVHKASMRRESALKETEAAPSGHA